MEKLESCPVCKSSQLTSYIQTKDYSISGESFNIDQCGSCGLRFTNPRPDLKEIDGYYKSESYISHTDSTSGVINNIYQKVKLITLRKKVNLIRKFSRKQNIQLLDFGCGTGDFLLSAKRAGMNVTGIEPSEDARKRAADKGLEVYSDKDLLTFSPEAFDAITLWHVLEHVHDLKAVFAQLCQIIKKNGYFFIALPNSDATDASIYDEAWAALDVPRHLYHFTPESFNYFISLFPVKLIHKQTMPFDPFYISLLSEKYKSGSSNFLTAFFNGLTGLVSGYKDVDKSSSIIYIVQMD